MVHRRARIADGRAGRARLVFEELFFVHILQQRAKQLAREHRRGITFQNRRDLTTRLREALPYQLTGAQVRSLREVFVDMCSDRRMQRLLQGDVGSGKTIVALFSGLLAIENGYQAALMVPTELLAEQHYGTIRPLLDERPPGRRTVVTARRGESARERVLAFIDREIEQGRQAYVVYPVIEDSEKTDLKAATTMYEHLAAGPFSHRRVALLHGRVAADERDRTMRAFRDGEIDVLVATTVIEVGIDVPNATVMLIEHPERFGLSQLHQLRGRVGRGAEQSYCILLGDVSPEVAERLDVFVGTDDGFEIARADLRLRGMGDLFGERQSGVPTFRIADPLRDEELNLLAQEVAAEVLEQDPELTRDEHAGLRRVLSERYGRAIQPPREPPWLHCRLLAMSNPKPSAAAE